MTKYLLRRTLSGLGALVLFTAGMFVLVEVLIPGDYFSPARLGMTAQEVDALRAQYGLDRPIYIRYVAWLRNFVFHGFGQSTTGFTRHGSLLSSIPATLLVFVVGLGLAYLFGSWLGRIAGWKRGSRGRALTFLAVTTYTIFPPFLGFLLVYFLGHPIGELRNSLLGTSVNWTQMDRSTVMAGMSITIIVSTIVVLVLGALAARLLRRRRVLSPLGKVVVIAAASFGWWAYRGILGYVGDVWFLAAVPILAFSILSYGDFLLVMRTSIIGVMKDDYVGTATAKGIPDRFVRDRHAGRNAVFPVLGRLIVSLPYLLSGLVIIEESVGWPGLGTVLFDAVSAQDMPLVMDVLLLIGIFTLIARIVFEVAQAALDPRVWRPA
jgi:peptide/nickel transport system permease protein